LRKKRIKKEFAMATIRLKSNKSVNALRTFMYLNHRQTSTKPAFLC
jgi:hypothetical protein